MSQANKRKFTPEQCRKGGSAIRGGEFAEESRQRDHTDQIELVYAGKIRHVTGETKLRGPLRWLRA